LSQKPTPRSIPPSNTPARGTCPRRSPIPSPTPSPQGRPSRGLSPLTGIPRQPPAPSATHSKARRHPHHHRRQCQRGRLSRRRSRRHHGQLRPRRKASKRRSQAQWLKDEPDHFHGSVHILRVQLWRAKNPGYSRKKRSSPEPEPHYSQAPLPKHLACQSDLVTQEITPPAPLQDTMLLQGPVIVGLLSVLGGTLQETLAPFTQRIVERGQRVLAQAEHSSGESTRGIKTIDST